MNLQQRIQAIQGAIGKINAAIAQVNAALANSVDPAEIANLHAQLTDLHAELQNLQFQLAHLQAAAGAVGPISPDAAARVQQLSGELARLAINGATVTSTLDFANAVLAKVSEIRQKAG
jgi:peptidoglycan hydrolase CwlO-like protein